MTPEHDAQTAIRSVTDIDWIEEEAWRIIETNGWRATPELLFALKAKLKQERDTNGS